MISKNAKNRMSDGILQRKMQAQSETSKLLEQIELIDYSFTDRANRLEDALTEKLEYYLEAINAKIDATAKIKMGIK